MIQRFKSHEPDSLLRKHPVQITKRRSHFICQSLITMILCNQMTVENWPFVSPQNKEQNHLWFSHVCGNCKVRAGKGDGDTSSYKLSENPVIQSWFHTASLPVRFWRSKFLRPVAPKSVTPPLAQNSSLTLLTPRKPRETVHFTHLLHKIHFRTSPAKSRDVIHSRPHQINLQYLARPNRPGENRRFQTANQILHRLRASAAAAFSDAPPRTLRQPSPVT